MYRSKLNLEAEPVPNSTLVCPGKGSRSREKGFPKTEKQRRRVQDRIDGRILMREGNAGDASVEAQARV